MIEQNVSGVNKIMNLLAKGSALKLPQLLLCLMAD